MGTVAVAMMFVQPYTRLKTDIPGDKNHHNPPKLDLILDWILYYITMLRSQVKVGIGKTG